MGKILKPISISIDFTNICWTFGASESIAIYRHNPQLITEAVYGLISLGTDNSIKSSKGNLPKSSLKYSFYKGVYSKKKENELSVKNRKILF